MARAPRGTDDSVIAQPVELTSIPLIDFTAFLAGDAQDRRETARKIAAACNEIGFFYLAGHGVPDAVTRDMFAQSAAFYHCADGDKQDARATADHLRGWVPPPASDGLSGDTRLFHQYLIQLRPEHAGSGVPDAEFLRWPNRWPAALPEFRAVAERYLDAMHRLSLELLRAFALGLDLPEQRFAEHFTAPPALLSLLHYPPLPAAAEIAVSNTVAHTDEGPVTILAQGAIGGLEVKRRDGVWIQAPPIAGTFTINVGDMLMWWSNGTYLSNLHRVRNRSGVERFSIPYFANPDGAVVVAPLPELCDATRSATYPPVRVSEHLARFYDRQRKHAKA